MFGSNFFKFAMLAAATAVLSPALAQSFPTRPITIVVPYAAGGPTDVSARALSEEMSKSLGVSVIIDNKPSAGGIVAATTVANAPKDGHTLLLSIATILVTNPSLYKKLPYKTTDFAPIGMYETQPYGISIPASIPAKTIPEFIAYAKAKPGGISFATVGAGTQSHIIAEWIGRRLGFPPVLIPYKGVSAAQADLISGRVDALTDGLTSAVLTHKAGQTRLIASMGRERGHQLPEGVQTFVEAGFPDLYAEAEFGLVAPAGTPDPVIRKLHSAMTTAMKNPVLLEKIRARGATPSVSASPAAYSELLRRETVRWAELIKPLNLTLD